MKKRILITGAGSGSGIGLDAAWALAERGHQVTATTFDEAQAASLRAQAASRGVALQVFKLDITSAADRQLILPLQLDVLINNAGIGESGSLIEPGAIYTGFNQAMTARKYTWMGPQSYFAGQVERMKAEEARTFTFLEAKSTRSIVAQIVKAAEASKPRLRYVAPWVQGFGVRLARIFGV